MGRLAYLWTKVGWQKPEYLSYLWAMFIAGEPPTVATECTLACHLAVTVPRRWLCTWYHHSTCISQVRPARVLEGRLLQLQQRSDFLVMLNHFFVTKRPCCNGRQKDQLDKEKNVICELRHGTNRIHRPTREHRPQHH